VGKGLRKSFAGGRGARGPGARKWGRAAATLAENSQEGVAARLGKRDHLFVRSGKVAGPGAPRSVANKKKTVGGDRTGGAQVHMARRQTRDANSSDTVGGNRGGRIANPRVLGWRNTRRSGCQGLETAPGLGQRCLST